MSVRTDFRKALQVALAKPGALDMPAVGGIIRPPEQSRDVFCVWWERKRPFGRDGNQEESFFRVRVLPLFRQNQGEQDFVNQERLEEVAELLEDVLKAVLTRPWLETAASVTLPAGSPDFFIVNEVVCDMQGQFVEALISAQMRNRSSTGG